MYYRFIHQVANILLRLICRISVQGLENIPEQGPFLIINNHLSAVDPPLVFSLLPVELRSIALAAMAHRNDFFFGWVMNGLGTVWVRRGQSDRRALRQSLEVLASGHPLAMAPEGTRTKTHALIEGRTGSAFLALKADVPILPIALSGTEQVFPSLLRLRRATVQVRIHPLFFLPAQDEHPRKEHLQYCTDLIMARLASMLPDPYRGVYAGHPLISYWEQLDTRGMADRPEWKRESATES